MKLPRYISFLIIAVILAAAFPRRTLCQQAPSPVSESISRRIADYQPEKAYIHLDRPTYLVGETLWFKMWVTDENLIPANLSRIGYLEVINGENQAVIQAKVTLENGRGSGAIPIPTDLPSGNYLVRGYTAWMKNFSGAHFFETTLCLINPFSPLPVSAPDNTTGSSGPALQFFPEGGSALPGIENKIAFKAQGPDGRGFNFTGKLLDQNGHTAAEFKPLVHGIGHFLFNPRKGHTYRAEITDEKGLQHTFPFDVIRPEGYAARLTESGNELKIEVSPGSPDAAGSTLHLLHYNSSKSTAVQARAEGGKASFSLPKSRLKPGVNVLVIFDHNLKPVAERLYFNLPAAEASATVSADKGAFNKREKISLNFKTFQLSDTLEASVSVFLTDSLPQVRQPDIGVHLLFTSELKGTIENPGYYFAERNAAAKEALDNVMLTHGWRRYKTEHLLRDWLNPEYLPEIRGHIITGKITSAAADLPLNTRPVFAAYPSIKIAPLVGMSDDKGRFVLEARNFTGARELVFQTNYRMDSTSRISVDSPFAPVTDATSKLDPLVLKSEMQTDILKRSINMQAVNSYFPQKRAAPPTDSIPFYGRPDFRYYLDDYTRFPTMEEILSEYVPAVSIRLRRGRYYTRVVETGIHTQFFTEDPLLLIDGIPVFDTDRIIHFDPLKVQRTDVVNRMYYLGPLAFPGIVSYSTYTHDLAGFEVDPRALILAYDGALEQRDFYAPRYDRELKNGRRLPDLRNLMYWSPSVSIVPGKETVLDFYTSDQPGRYKIVVQGLSAKGTPLSAVSEFTVND